MGDWGAWAFQWEGEGIVVKALPDGLEVCCLRLLFELSGEHPELPAAEAEALALTANPSWVTLVREPGVLVLGFPEGTSYPCSRLAYSHAVHKHLFSCAISELKECLARALETGLPELHGGETVAVRVRRAKGTKLVVRAPEMERDLGELLRSRYRIRLVAPDLSLRVLLSTSAHVGTTVWEQAKEPLRKRRAQHRSFFSPISLPPKLARAMVNLAAVAPGSTVLDPFCGTGGILLEAGEMGMRLIGGDLDPRMVEGCRRNLAQFGLGALRLQNADVGELGDLLRGERVDAVVTDPPYGRASSTRGEGLREVYSRLFKVSEELLAPGGRLVLSLPDPSLAQTRRGLRLLHQFRYPVHKSLTRHLLVFERCCRTNRPDTENAHD